MEDYYTFWQIFERKLRLYKKITSMPTYNPALYIPHTSMDRSGKINFNLSFLEEYKIMCLMHRPC